MSSLTGIVYVQCLLYYRLYPGDFVWTKVLVRQRSSPPETSSMTGSQGFRGLGF